MTLYAPASVDIAPYPDDAYTRWDTILTEPGFVIVGTGRSGTGYISQVFTRLGIRCGHESWWNPSAVRSPSLKGDASWLAVPHLPGYTGKVGLQIRDPLAVMRSLLNGDLFDLARTNLYYRYKAAYVDFTGDPVIDAALYITEWTAMAVPYAERLWRVEDIDAAYVSDLSEWVGYPVTEQRAAVALDGLDAEWNRHNRVDLEWGDLPDHPVIDRLRAVAETGGYV